LIAQPPLSTQIRQLETELGVPVFVCDVKGVTVTTGSETLSLRARLLLAGVEELPRLMRPDDAEPRTALRVGVIPSVLHTVLPEAVAQLRDAGAAELLPVELSAASQIAPLQKGRLDCEFVRHTDMPSVLDVLCARDDPWAVASTATSRARPAAGR
jgi:DNA-binding transcriptional LysR family regulator